MTWTGAGGATFEQHPLRFDNAAFGPEDTGSTASRTFDASGVYAFHCFIHGPTGMRGTLTVTDNHLPVPSFTASATDVASGTEVTFDASGSSDPDPTQFVNYTWDLDGDGADDPGQTSVNPSAVFTNTGTTPRNVTVRLTATDTNDDAVGPESASRSMVITVQPLQDARGVVHHERVHLCGACCVTGARRRSRSPPRTTPATARRSNGR